MGQLVVNGAMMACSFGAAPASLAVLPVGRVQSSNQPAANIMDNKPMVNIMPFGACQSMANPQVAAATSAAMGVLTPMPCIPMTSAAPWAPGAATVMLANQPALDTPSKLMCQWAGVIEIQVEGVVLAHVPALGDPLAELGFPAVDDDERHRGGLLTRVNAAHRQAGVPNISKQA